MIVAIKHYKKVNMVDLQLRPNSPIQLELMLTSTATKKILIHLQAFLPFRGDASNAKHRLPYSTLLKSVFDY